MYTYYHSSPLLSMLWDCMYLYSFTGDLVKTHFICGTLSVLLRANLIFGFGVSRLIEFEPEGAAFVFCAFEEDGAALVGDDLFGHE